MDNNRISRRSFLKASAIATSGAIVAPNIISSCVKGANDRILMAHIGVGSMGAATVKHWFMPVDGAFSVATCDPFARRRNGMANYINNTYKKQGVSAQKCKAYLDMDEIFERSDIDAVNITTPDHWHLSAAIKAARAGKHIFLAKPLGLSYPNYKILEKEIKANNVKFHYGTQQRAMGHMKMAINAIKEGQIGEIERVEVWAPGGGNAKSPICTDTEIPEGFDYDRWIGPAPLSPYCPDRVTNVASWFQYDYSIGFLAGWGAHPLDIMVWALKDKLNGKYTCEGTGSFWKPGGLYNTINSWDLNYEYESGIKVRFASIDNAAKQNIWHYRKVKDDNATTFFGSKGWISVGRGTAETDIPGLQTKFNEFPRRGNNNRIVNDGYKTGREFIDVVNGKIEETNPLDEAIISDCISHMGNIAIRTGKKISWDPIKGEILNDAKANKWFVREMREPYSI